MSDERAALKAITEKMIEFSQLDIMKDIAPKLDLSIAEDEEQARLILIGMATHHDHAVKIVNELLITLWKTPAGKAAIQEVGGWSLHERSSLTHLEQPA